MTFPVTEHTVKTARHTTGYLACGAEKAPLLIFCHGWPELSLSWRHQLPAFAALGFRCVAPDMRGYGRSSTYTRHEDFAPGADRRGHARAPGRARPRQGGVDRPRLGQPGGVEHRRPPSRQDGGRGQPLRALSRRRASRWTSSCRWSTARSIPRPSFRSGQWDYQFFYEESFDKARKGFEANIRNVVKALFRKGDPRARRQAQPHGVGAQGRRLGRRRRASPTCRAMPTSSASRTWRPTSRR